MRDPRFRPRLQVCTPGHVPVKNRLPAGAGGRHEIREAMAMSSNSESYAGFYLVGFAGAIVGVVIALIVFGAGVLTEHRLSSGHAQTGHGAAAGHENPPARRP